MAALIDTLISTTDNKFIVRDQIAGILKLESDNQKLLALAAGEDDRRWGLLVYSERARPWSDYIDQIDDPDNAPRIVNVAFDTFVYDGAASDPVRQQKGTATYNIDCFGYGVTRQGTTTGHVAGDLEARQSAERALTLTRNILMSAQYTYLGLRGTVWKRMPESEQAQDIPIEQVAQNVAVARLRLNVDMAETAPQVTGEIMGPDSIYATVRRAEDGSVYFNGVY